MPWQTLRLALFGGRISYPIECVEHAMARIWYVGNCCAVVSDKIVDSNLSTAVEELLLDSMAGAV